MHATLYSGGIDVVVDEFEHLTVARVAYVFMESLICLCLDTCLFDRTLDDHAQVFIDPGRSITSLSLLAFVSGLRLLSSDFKQTLHVFTIDH